MLLMVQSDSGDQNASLVACARYSIQDELQQLGHKVTARIHAIFVIQLPRIAGGCFNGFQVIMTDTLSMHLSLGLSVHPSYCRCRQDLACA